MPLRQGAQRGSFYVSRKATSLLCRYAPLLLAVSLAALLPDAFAKKKKAKASSSDADSLPGMKREELNDPSNPNLSYGNNPLHDAARDNDHVLVKKIIDRVPGIFSDPRFHKWDYQDAEDYPEVGDKNDAGNTALHLALWMGATEAAQLLLGAGADVNVRNRVLSCARSLVLVRRRAIAQAGNSPLHYAARHKEDALTRQLLAAGADARAKCDRGFTPLHYAAFEGAVSPGMALLERGAVVNAVNDKGYTALHVAAEHHQTGI